MRILRASLLGSAALFATLLADVVLLGVPAAAAGGTRALAGAHDDDERGDIINGRRLFLRENCYGCHGGRGGGGMCPSLRENPPDRDDAEDAIEDGTDDGMPAYGDRLSDQEIADLVAYLRSLRTDREPTFTHWWEPVPSQ